MFGFIVAESDGTIYGVNYANGVITYAEIATARSNTTSVVTGQIDGSGKFDIATMGSDGLTVLTGGLGAFNLPVIDRSKSSATVT